MLLFHQIQEKKIKGSVNREITFNICVVYIFLREKVKLGIIKVCCWNAKKSRDQYEKKS